MPIIIQIQLLAALNVFFSKAEHHFVLSPLSTHFSKRALDFSAHLAFSSLFLALD
jgi:hypothetical protein